MFGSGKKQPDVLSHWFTLVDNFQYSSQDFYKSVEDELRSREAPGLTISRTEFNEGGSLSHKRIYLRMARERFAFDLCAAPFGRAYFFSVRFVETPRGGWLRLFLILLLLFVLYRVGIAAYFLARVQFWWFAGITSVLAVAVLTAKGLRAQEKSADGGTGGIPDLDTLLIRLPGIGAWYEASRKDTYYRHDTRLMYHTLVLEIVKKKVEEVTAAKGVKLVRAYERSPILGDIYKATTVGAPSEPAAV